MNIGLVYPTNRQGVDSLKSEVISALESFQVSVVDQIDDISIADVDFVITIGGDGTVLKAVSYMTGKQVPIMAINLGHLGYLTEVEPVNVLSSIKNLINGEFNLERRMILRAGVRRNQGMEIQGLTALNDVVIEKIEPGKTIRFKLFINEAYFESYSADGIVICTPTGSTAYNLSIQGPIVAPDLDAVVITPIAPHLVFDRSLVLDSSVRLKLEINGDRQASLVVDGSVKSVLQTGDLIEVNTKKEHVELVKFKTGEYFIEKLKSKF